MFTLKTINQSADNVLTEAYFYLGENFTISYPEQDSSSDPIAMVAGEGLNAHPVYFWSEAYIINERGQTVKVLNRSRGI